MNSAQALAEVFDQLAASGSDKKPISTRWADLLDTPEMSADYHLALAVMQARLDRLQDEINASGVGERSKKLFLAAIHALRPFILPHHLNGRNVAQLKQVQPQIDILFMAAETLPRYLVPDINPLTLVALGEEIEALIDAIELAVFEPRLKSTLIAQLTTILLSIRSYGVLGPEGAARVYGAAAAELARVSRDASSNQGSNKRYVRKALSVCKKVGAAVIFASAVVGGATDMIEDGSTLLGISPPNEPGEDAPTS